MTNKIVFTLRVNLARSGRHDFLYNFCEYLLWVKANEVNYLAVSSQRVQRSERRLNICNQVKNRSGMQGYSLLGKKTTILKITWITQFLNYVTRVIC